MCRRFGGGKSTDVQPTIDAEVATLGSTKSKETVGKILLWQQMWMRKNLESESERRTKRSFFFFQTRLMAIVQNKGFTPMCHLLLWFKVWKKTVLFLVLCVMLPTVPWCQVWDIKQATYESILDCYCILVFSALSSSWRSAFFLCANTRCTQTMN